MSNASDYDYMSDLLKQWGLADYVPVFINEKVDAECLRIIDDGDIKQLIPLAGDRARFKSNLAHWKSESNVDILNSPTPAEEASKPVEITYVGEVVQHNIAQTFTFDSQLDGTASADANSVLKLLKSTIDGKAILNNGHENEGLLVPALKSRLARLIATKELTDNRTGVVPGHRLMELAHEIKQIFPRESTKTYYIPYVRGTSKKSKRNASGKLHDTVVNRRRDLRKRGVIAGSSRTSRSSVSGTSFATEETLLTISSTHSEDASAVEEKLHWLRNSVDPWHLVESNWEATTNVRLATLRSKPGTVEDYLNLYPALKQPDGYRLLLQDFNHIYKNNKDFLYSNIILYQKSIVRLAKSKLTELKDKDVKQAIQNCTDSISDSKPESETNAALLLLPYLVPSIVSTKKGIKPWKPSRSEIRDGFLLQIADVADLQTAISSRRTKLAKLGRTFQPLVIYTGTVCDITNIYVIVGQTVYKVNSLLQGVDVTFKIIQATGAEYSDDSYIIWLFIQRALYNINTTFDKSLSVLHSLIGDLNVN